MNRFENVDISINKIRQELLYYRKLDEDIKEILSDSNLTNESTVGELQKLQSERIDSRIKK